MLRLWSIFLVWFLGNFRFYRLEYFTWRMEIEVFERINVAIFPLNSTYTKNQEQGENQNEFCGAGLEFKLPIYVNLSISISKEMSTERSWKQLFISNEHTWHLGLGFFKKKFILLHWVSVPAPRTFHVAQGSIVSAQTYLPHSMCDLSSSTTGIEPESPALEGSFFFFFFGGEVLHNVVWCLAGHNEIQL